MCASAFLPAGGVVEPILATAGAAGWRTCGQSPWAPIYGRSACPPASESVGVSPMVELTLVSASLVVYNSLTPRSRSPRRPAGLESVQDLTPVLAERRSSLWKTGRVQEDCQLDLLNKALVVELLPLRFCLGRSWKNPKP